MKIKRFFSLPTFPLAAAFLSLSAAAPLMAELPTSPLDGEFTTSSNEYVYANWWWKLEIGPSGVWNIAGDLAQVNWGYEGANNGILTGSGTLNIGSDTEAGAKSAVLRPLGEDFKFQRNRKCRQVGIFLLWGNVYFALGNDKLYRHP